jgi:hypothetical protein
MTAAQSKGGPAGGVPLGLRLSTVIYEVGDPAEAEEVEKVFELTATGISIRRVAALMRATHERRWTTRQVHRCLHREEYRELGLVSNDLWQRAHASLESRRRGRKDER